MSVKFPQFDLPGRVRGGSDIGDAEFLVDADYFDAPSQAVTQSSRFDNAQTFYAGTVSTTITVAQDTRFDNTQTFYGGVVSLAGGAQTVTQSSRFDNTNTFYGGRAARGTLVPLPLELDGLGISLDGQQLYLGVFFEEWQLYQNTRFSNTNTFYGGAVTLGGGSLSITQSSRFDNATTFYAGEVNTTLSAALTITDQADTLSSTAAVAVGAAATITDAQDTASSSAQALVQVALTQQDQADTLTSAAAAAVVASLSQQDDADALTGAAALTVVAALTVTDQADTIDSTVVVVPAGGVLVSAELTDQSDTLSASAEVTQPPIDDAISLGGRKRRDWRKFQNLPAWEVTAEARLSDDDDTLTSGAQVLAIKPAPIVAVFEAFDDADDVLAGCVVRWPIPQLLRTSPPLIRTTASAGR